MSRLFTLLAALLLAGCTSGPRIDSSHTAVSQGPRVDLLVLHYTVLDFPKSLFVLTNQVVSSHYLVDVDPPTIYRLVDENKRANHAGISQWARRTMVNMSSIGIEIVNNGYVDGPNGRVYTPFPPHQIDAVVALVRDIVTRWGIPPERVVGHADIAPGRKQDPGPLFPWKRLADEGLALWFDEARAAALQPRYEASLPDLAWFRQRLAQFGYGVPLTGVDQTLDKATRDVLISFQMRFRPARYDGQPDAETAAILATLTTP
ncbi:MAG: N-acetylmuramoyl-L-alanine amidase [Rubrivivax sp.]|nr:N-acetylmuramoyl-L-alanine amidase [Rubrivivax sp.]MBK7263183.1 N-acetylmuramoyl-L-alanine amidase [Rubrivivax sp.]MBK8529266.1 N-acetylmuramoyl-L-alanine amidase [Rubrivivax sp.]